MQRCLGSMGMAMMNVMPYMMSPEVQQAMTAQAQAMAQAGR